jgi:predicted permease
MQDFSPLLLTLAPMFALIGGGFIAGRWIGVRGEAIAPLLIYLITPCVVFGALLRAPLSLSTLVLPGIICALCFAVCLLTLRLTRTWVPAPGRNLIAFAAGNANSGYFAIPVGIALFGENSMPLIVLSGFGFLLFENTLGVFVLALGKFSAREAGLRVLKLPVLYAFALGLSANALGLELSPRAADFHLMLRHTYSVLGMMLLGLGLAAMKDFRLDSLFIGTTLVAKHLLWPCAALLLLWAEHTLLGALTPEERKITLFMSVLPLAANTVAWATLLNAEPEKASCAVLLSTLCAPFSLMFLPTLLTWI